MKSTNTKSPQVPDLIDPAVLAQTDTVEVPRLLRPDQVAEYLHISERTLERWRMCGEGPQYLSLSKKLIRYAAEHLREFLAGRVKANTAQ